VPRKPSPKLDKYALYQESVQAADYEIEFLEHAYRRHNRRLPLRLREDFCGTALLCAEWVKSRADRTATGIDLDPVPLAWGRAHNVAPLGPERASRVELLRQDVKVPARERFDVVCAYNYSYSVFHSRRELVEYFAAVHASLHPDGLFSIDAVGGWESQQVTTEFRSMGSYTYVWEQASYDPISSRWICHIHFEPKRGRSLRRAFTYDWRLWTLAELREAMLDAGFAEVEAYWEGEDEDGEGTGTFHRADSVSNDPAWNAYLVAKKRARRKKR
jgi:SAM-dependent methyltransferase